MFHDFCRDHLGQYLDRSLDAIEREKVESHLQVCADCAQIAREMAAIRTAMGEMTPFSAPPQLRQNVRAALQQEALQQEALQKQRIKSATRPKFGIRLPQLAWSGSLALGAIMLLVLARPFAQSPITPVEPQSASSADSGAAPSSAAPSSAAPSSAAPSSAAPNRTIAPNRKIPDRVESSSPVKSSSAVQPTRDKADRSSNLSAEPNANRTGGAARSRRNATEAERPLHPISSAQTKNGATAASSSLPDQNAGAAAPDAPQSGPIPSSPRDAIRPEQPQTPQLAKSSRQRTASETMPPRLTAKSAATAAPASAAPASAAPASAPSPISGRAAPAPTVAVEKPQPTAPRMSRSRYPARRETAPDTSPANEGGIQPQILRQRAAPATRAQLPSPLLSLRLRAMPAPTVAPSTAAADAMTASAASRAAPSVPAPSNAASRAISGAMSPGAASQGGLPPQAAPQSDEAGRADASRQRPNALFNAAPPGGLARSMGGRGGSSTANAPRIAASESRDAAVARQASDLRAVRRFSLQVRVARAEKNARIRIEAAAPARLLWPRSGVVWSGDLTAGTPLEIEFSLGGVRGGEKISIVLEQKLAGAPSRIIATQTLTVPPAPG